LGILCRYKVFACGHLRGIGLSRLGRCDPLGRSLCLHRVLRCKRCLDHVADSCRRLGFGFGVLSGRLFGERDASRCVRVRRRGRLRRTAK